MQFRSEFSNFTIFKLNTIKTPSKIQHICNVHLQWFFSSLYFSSIGICYTIERRKKITVFKYIQKGNRKVFNLNPVPKGKNKKKQFYECCLYNKQSEIPLS